MNIQDIIKQASYDYSHNNRFKVTLNAPEVLRSFPNEAISVIQRNIININLPGTEILTAEWQNKGPTVLIPYKRNFNNLNITFLNDKQNLARRFFEEWIRGMYSLNSYDWAYRNESVANITIEAENKQGDTSALYAIEGAFPVSIEDIGLDASDGEIQTFSVEMAYTHYILQ